MYLDLFLSILAFFVLWVGSGMAIMSVEKMAKHLKISSFLVSFLALGFLTSTTEISVAYFSVIDKTPGISVGNLIGASIFISLLLIPLLAVINKKIQIDVKKDPINFPLAMVVVSLPTILVIDKALNKTDAYILIVAVVVLALTISNKRTMLDKIENAINSKGLNILKELSKTIFGLGLIIFSCKYIIDTSVFYATEYNISPFLIGLILITIGTNLPELSILLRSVVLKKKGIALGDYVGSATFNTLTLGGLILFNGETIFIDGGLKYNILLLPIGAAFLIYFIRNKKLERKEGLFIIFLYVLFLALEFLMSSI